MNLQQTTQFKIFKTEIICYLISGCTFDKTCSCDRTKLIHCYYFSILFLISILFKQFKTKHYFVFTAKKSSNYVIRHLEYNFFENYFLQPEKYYGCKPSIQ